jgi:hypothetical protein
MKLKVFLFLVLFFSSFVVFADGYGLQLCNGDTTLGCVTPSNCTSAGLIVVKTGQESFGGLYTCMASDPCPAGKHTDTNQSSSTYGQCIDDLKLCPDGVTYVDDLAKCPCPEPLRHNIDPSILPCELPIYCASPNHLDAFFNICVSS